MAWRLIKLATPIIGVNVLAVVTLAVDTAMVGRLPHKKLALTALGFATQLAFLLMVAVMGLAVGCASLAARAFGAKDHGRVERILGQGVLLTAFVAAMVALVANLAGPYLLVALGAEPKVAALGMEYLGPLLSGAFFYYLSLLFAAVLRGLGNTRLPFFIALVINAINIVANYGLILGNLGMPALGVRGAAYGTIIAYATGVLIYVLLAIGGGATRVKLRLSALRLDRELMRAIARVGWPAAMDMVVLNAAFISIVGMLGRLEQIAVGAHGMGLRVQGLAFVPGLAVSQATAALVGQALGAGDRDGARAVTRASVIVCTALMGALAITIVLAAHPIVRIFDIEPSTRLGELSVMWIRQLGYCMPLVGVYIAFVGTLQGAGSTRTSLGINTFTTLVFQIPLSAVLGFAFGLGAFGVWVAFPLSFVVKAALGFVYYRRGKWARVGVE